MLIRLGYDIQLEITQPMAVVAVLNVHPSRVADLREPDEIQMSPEAAHEQYWDSLGNICTRIIAPQGTLRLWNTTLIEDSGQPDAVDWSAQQVAVEELPTETLQFLLASRYCEVDRLSNLAWQLFGNTAPGWPRVQTICNWVHQNITFG